MRVSKYPDMHRQRELDGLIYMPGQVRHLSSRINFPDKHVLAATAPTRRTRTRRCCDHYDHHDRCDRPVSSVAAVLRTDAWESYDENRRFRGVDERLR